MFDPRANALNAIRLLLAIGVIFWHSFALSGRDIEFLPLRQLVGEVGVDGFFAVSGFLIVASWRRDPSWWRFLAARALRIFPAFWVCLLATATVLAPLGTILTTGQSYAEVTSRDNLDYVVQNSLLVIREARIGDTPSGIPYVHAWNGSLWTLRWEFLCYLIVLALGVVRLVGRRFTLPLLFAAALWGSILTSYADMGGPPERNLSRFVLMFVAGALIQRYAHRIPLTWSAVTFAYALVLGSMFLDDYRVVAAIPLAYAVLGTGALLKSERLRFRHDLSYGVYIYGFPVQQTLASTGIGVAGVSIFAIVSLACTLPLAAASWFLIEKPALRLRPRKAGKPTRESSEVIPAGTPGGL